MSRLKDFRTAWGYVRDLHQPFLGLRRPLVLVGLPGTGGVIESHREYLDSVEAQLAPLFREVATVTINTDHPATTHERLPHLARQVLKAIP